jgi:glycosyltransferase involved in cell wall biosynthesis
MNSNPLVSVLIPAYNCAQYISQSIDSVLAQGVDNLEIIVADDGSTDDTVKLFTPPQPYGEGSGVRYFYKSHSGISATRNFCLEKAQGKYVAWVDADDFWLKGKLQAQLDYITRTPDCRIVFTRYRNWLEDEKLFENDRIKHEVSLEQKLKRYLSSSLIERSVFDTVGGFEPELAVGEDTELISRIEYSGISTAHFIDEVYYVRRIHAANTSLNYPVYNDMLKKYLSRNLLKFKLKK